MSYAEKIAEAFREGALISINRQMNIHQLDDLYKTQGVMYICHDGWCLDTIMENGEVNAY